MLAGVGAVDACLFVVAATEGWKPQSEEHLRILELLGLGHGVVALTKADLVDDEWLRAATTRRRAIALHGHVPRRRPDRRRSARRPGAGSTSCAPRSTSSSQRRRRPPTAAGRACGSTASFAAKGSGTVVTGTLTGGALHDRPAGRRRRRTTVRVRGVQTHGRATSIDRARQPRRAQPRRRRPHRARTRRRRRRRRASGGRRRASTPRCTCSHCARPRGVPPRRVPRLHRLGRAPGEGARARQRRDRPGRRRAGAPAPRRRRSRCCPATATCCASPVATRPSAAARCSTSRPCCRRRRPDPTARSTGWSPSAAGSTSTSSRR